MVVISWGRGGSCGSWKLNYFIHKLLEELVVELQHIPRSQNSLADKIAKWCAG